jgi:hypothetical protein
MPCAVVLRLSCVYGSRWCSGRSTARQRFRRTGRWVRAPVRLCAFAFRRRDFRWSGKRLWWVGENETSEVQLHPSFSLFWQVARSQQRKWGGGNMTGWWREPRWPGAPWRGVRRAVGERLEVEGQARFRLIWVGMPSLGCFPFLGPPSSSLLGWRAFTVLPLP